VKSAEANRSNDLRFIAARAASLAIDRDTLNGSDLAASAKCRTPA